MTVRHRWRIAIAALVATMVMVAFGGGASGGDRTPEFAGILDSDVVISADELTRTVVIDASGDVEKVNEWLIASHGKMDGWTIAFEGMQSLDAEEQAAAGAAAAAEGGGEPVKFLCPSIPEGPRSTDGSTTPYFGCDYDTGEEHWGKAETGDPGASLGRAVDAVLAAMLPGADLKLTEVSLDKGLATVDLDARFPESLRYSVVPAGDIYTLLLFTSSSNGAISAVTYRVAGDCLAYSVATGGDMCSTTQLPIVLK